MVITTSQKIKAMQLKLHKNGWNALNHTSTLCYFTKHVNHPATVGPAWHCTIFYQTHLATKTILSTKARSIDDMVRR